MILNASTNLPSGMTHADYNRLAGSKVEFIRVNELPTSYIKEYPTIYILMKDDSIGIMYEYNSSTNTWLKYGGDLGIIPITGEEYDNLSEEDKNKDVFYLITDRIAYLEDVAVMKGATAEADGTTGTVPVPKAGDQNKFLRGDGTWAESSGGNSSDNTPYTITTSEDGNTFTQTYDDGRVVTITKTTTGFREISTDSSGNVVSDITTTINDDGSIRSENTSK